MFTIEKLTNELAALMKQQEMHKEMFMQTSGAIQLINAQIKALEDYEKQPEEQKDGETIHKEPEQITEG